MKKIKSHFKFNKQERSGIFFLLLFIFLLQLGYFLIRSNAVGDTSQGLFTLDVSAQSQIDSLKEKVLLKDKAKIYPFNPNFITDYKGYTLGMSVNEINRLHDFRDKDKYVNSKEDFQKVTQISDSLLRVISPYFKFPEWTQKSKRSEINIEQPKVERRSFHSSNVTEEVFSIKDINSATAEDLKSINGIGEILSARIIKFRNLLGGFLIEEQLYDVYGLEADVVKRVLLKYKVLNKPVIKKINVNKATAGAISSLVYIKYAVATNIVAFRQANGPFISLNELRNIEDFPSDKIDRIALYLSL